MASISFSGVTPAHPSFLRLIQQFFIWEPAEASHLLPRVWRSHNFYWGLDLLPVAHCWSRVPAQPVISPRVRAPVTHQDGVACQSCTVLTAPWSTQPHLPGGPLSLFLSWGRVSFQEMHIPIIFPSIAYHQRPLCNLPVSVQTLEY